MSEGRPVENTKPADAVGRVLETLARAAAVAGGLVLTAAMIVTVVSVIGRAFANVAIGIPGLGWVGPIPGDYEIVELAAAIGVGAFLPICQMRAGHVLVDLFFANSGRRALSAFSAIANLLFAVVGGVIVWRLWLGALSKFQYQESTMILQVNLGWGYLALAISFALASLCAAYLLVRDTATAVKAQA